MDPEPAPVEPIEGARVLAVLGDSVTTDHISPAGAIKKDSPAGQWLIDNGVEVRDFNSYGSRRGNHEVMIRGTFANVRLRNALVEREGGFTRHFPDGEETTIYDAAMSYADDDVPLVVLAGKEYGSGSSRDWAAKGTALLGVRAVIAESFERIHRSNLIGMGVLPLQFPDGETLESLGLTGEEDIDGRRPRERGGQDGRGDRLEDGGDPVSSRRGSASTPRTRSATSSTAASSTGSCATSALSPRRGPIRALACAKLAIDIRWPMHNNGLNPQIRVQGERRGKTLKTRPRPVPPPGTIASASLPGYRRAGVARAVWTPCLPRPRLAIPTNGCNSRPSKRSMSSSSAAIAFFAGAPRSPEREQLGAQAPAGPAAASRSPPPGRRR